MTVNTFRPLPSCVHGFSNGWSKTSPRERPFQCLPQLQHVVLDVLACWHAGHVDATQTRNGRLIIVCGLPGGGKTTVARLLERERGAVRMNADEWLTSLGLSLWDATTRARVEKLQWSQAQCLLVLGVSVVIEWGSWGRAERDHLRSGARAVGATVELVYLEVADDELWEGTRTRGAEDPPVTRTDLDNWRRLFQAPDEAEMALYDPPPPLPN